MLVQGFQSVSEFVLSKMTNGIIPCPLFRFQLVRSGSDSVTGFGPGFRFMVRVRVNLKFKAKAKVKVKVEAKAKAKA